MYINKIQSRITFKVNSRCFIYLLTAETIKLLGSIENKISEDKNGENIPHLEITEVKLVFCNIIDNAYYRWL